MSVAGIINPATGVIKPEYLPTAQHLNWTTTLIYSSSSFPPVATQGPPAVNPISINLPNDIAFNELIGLSVVAWREGAGSSWTMATDTIQWNTNQFNSSGAFGYETGSGCISNIPDTNSWIQNNTGVASIASQQLWFYFEPTAFPVDGRQVSLWATGTPNAGAFGKIEVWLYRQNSS